MTKRTVIAPVLLAAAALSTTPAAAQINLSEEEMEVFARAAMPAALRSLQTRCDPVLGTDAYMFARGDALQRRLTSASEAAWPDAVRLVARVAARGNPAMGEVLAGMPPESLRPFVSEMVAGMVNQRVAVDQCERIDRVLKLLDPLPPENLSQLVAYAYAEAQAEDGAGSGTAR